jgi:excisionase family DNA binding protein
MTGRGRPPQAPWAANLAEVHEPSVEEIQAARMAVGILTTLDQGDMLVSIAPEPDGHVCERSESFTLPATLFRTLVTLVEETGKGNAVAIVPVGSELTTQQAADLLDISRPHLVKLLARGELPYRMVGTHRKIRARDVLRYRARTAPARS